MENLKSSVQSVGEVVTQIIHFSGGEKKTFKGILTSTIQDGTFTKMMMADGRMLMVNGKNVDCIEVFSKK